MKKLLSLLLILALCISLFAGCSSIVDRVKDRLPDELEGIVDDLGELYDDLTGSSSTVAPSAEPTAEPSSAPTPTPTPEPTEPPIAKEGSYTSRDDVALYIHTYGCLPDNFITKAEAERLGWSGGSLEGVAPGKSIGGDRFGNYEGLLPKAAGRTYTECDIGTQGASSRGAKRIVFSSDGLIYYTADHYESFTLLYE